MISSRFISVMTATVMLATGVHALSPIPPCDGEEEGMHVYNAEYFGHEDSGFVAEGYLNLNTADGIIGGAAGPIPELNDFNGIRVTECRTGKMIAVHGVAGYNAFAPLLATEFLRKRNQKKQAFRFGDVKRAATALFADDSYTRMVELVETVETCGCDLLYPDRWN